MFRVSLNNAFAKRSLRPLHEKHQATPVNVLLALADPTDKIYSGMVAALTVDGTVDVYASGTAWGLFALDKNDVIDDTNGQPTDLGSETNGTPFAVWQGGPDAYFRVTDPKVGDADCVISGTGFAVGAPVYAAAGGLIDATGTVVIGNVVEVIEDGVDLVIQLSAPAS